MDLADLARWRMHAQLLSDSPARTAEQVIAHLGASQGQDYLPGTWSLAQRCRVVPQHTVLDKALDEGRILRTHVLRPTWHLVDPRALPWLLGATAARVHQANKHYYRQVEVDDALMTRVRPVLESLLTDHHTTRELLAVALGRAGIEASGIRLGYILMWAELEAWVVSGARAGKQQTYALYAERVPDPSMVPQDEALGLLAERYFSSRGPATLKDLARWASLTLAQAKVARDVAGSALEELEVGGRTYLHGAGQAPPPQSDARVDLLQQYDELGMSFSESRDVLVGGRTLTFGPPTGLFHTITFDDRLVGHWRYTRDGQGRPDAVETWFYEQAPPADLLDDAVTRFGVFAGRDVSFR